MKTNVHWWWAKASLDVSSSTMSSLISPADDAGPNQTTSTAVSVNWPAICMAVQIKQMPCLVARAVITFRQIRHSANNCWFTGLTDGKMRKKRKEKISLTVQTVWEVLGEKKSGFAFYFFFFYLARLISFLFCFCCFVVVFSVGLFTIFLCFFIFFHFLMLFCFGFFFLLMYISNHLCGNTPTWWTEQCRWSTEQWGLPAAG